MTHYRLFVLMAMLMALGVNAETITVSNSSDTGAGSLRQAVLDANADDVIDFDNSLTGQTIQLNSAIAIDINLTVQGPGADQLTVSGGGSSQLFVITNGAEVTFSGLEFIDGNGVAGGAIAVSGAETVLNLMACQFLNNAASSTGGAIDNDGAGINIFDSTLSANTVGIFGGAINNSGGGQLFIRNTTLSGNQSTDGDGGAITNLGGTLDIANSAVINNFADNFAGGLGNNSPSMISNIRNTIVAGNDTRTGSGLEIGNLAGTAGIVSGGGNLIGAVQGAGDGGTVGVFDQPNDQTGTVADPLDAQLEPIGDNGGPTLTHLPMQNSPVLDNGVDVDLPQSDQRGLSRVANQTVDIGPVEVQSAADFAINLGMAGSWFEPATNGQGWVFDVVDNATTQLLAAAWFTFDTGVPAAPQPGDFGNPQQRWFSALGNFTGNTAVLDIFSPTNGVFNDPNFLVNRGDPVGSMTVSFFDCVSGEISFDFDSPDVVDDTVQITRIASSALCQAIVDGQLVLSE